MLYKIFIIVFILTIVVLGIVWVKYLKRPIETSMDRVLLLNLFGIMPLAFSTLVFTVLLLSNNTNENFLFQYVYPENSIVFMDESVVNFFGERKTFDARIYDGVDQYRVEIINTVYDSDSRTSIVIYDEFDDIIYMEIERSDPMGEYFLKTKQKFTDTTRTHVLKLSK